MSELQYTTIDRLFAKFSRDLRGTTLNESDVIEWIGEALEFLKVFQFQEQAVAFLEVKDFVSELPVGFQMVLQIARNNEWSSENQCKPCDIISAIDTTSDIDPCATKVLTTNCNGYILNGEDIVAYRPQFDINLNYENWQNNPARVNNFTPVRLANHTLFNTIVCKEKDFEGLYQGVEDEYTIVGMFEKQLRFSFKEGQIALAYLKSAIDSETGYPLIPDEISCITAISYYVKWKIAEWFAWNKREGYNSIAQNQERLWIKYVKQAKNKAKMPKTLDDYQDLLEQSHSLIPSHKKYYGFFGNLGKGGTNLYNNSSTHFNVNNNDINLNQKNSWDNTAW
jgi:hypothetical protein